MCAKEEFAVSFTQTTTSNPFLGGRYFMHSIDIVIQNKLGLHARAAAKLTELASQFTDCEIFIARDKQRVNAKSIMGVMMLAAGMGITVTVDAQGPQAKEALKAIEALILSKFGEAE